MSKLKLLASLFILFLAVFIRPVLVNAEEGTFVIPDDIVPTNQIDTFLIGRDSVPNDQVGTFPLPVSDAVPTQQVGTFPIIQPPPSAGPVVVSVPSTPPPAITFNPSVTNDISNNLQQSQNQSQSQSQTATGGTAISNSSTGAISVNVSGGSQQPAIIRSQPQPVVVQRVMPVQAQQPVIQTVAAAPSKTVPTVETLPKTGPSWLSLSLLGLIPLGWRLRKYGFIPKEESSVGHLVWQQRDFFKI